VNSSKTLNKRIFANSESMFFKVLESNLKLQRHLSCKNALDSENYATLNHHLECDALRPFKDFGTATYRILAPESYSLRVTSMTESFYLCFFVHCFLCTAFVACDCLHRENNGGGGLCNGHILPFVHLETLMLHRRGHPKNL